MLILACQVTAWSFNMGSPLIGKCTITALISEPIGTRLVTGAGRSWARQPPGAAPVRHAGPGAAPSFWGVFLGVFGVIGEFSTFNQNTVRSSK
jgi:hypothetical protein